MFVYQDFIQDVRVIADGRVEVIDAQGNVVPNPALDALRADNPDKSFIIQDKNGDQWVIKPDGTVEKAGDCHL